MSILPLSNIEALSEKVFSSIENNYNLFKAICFLLILTFTALIRIDLWTFSMNYDTFYYAIKAYEITQGDWTPISFQSIGWSAFISIFFKLFAVDTLTGSMISIRIITLILTSLIIFPFAAIAKKLFDKKTSILALIVFVLLKPFTFKGLEGLSEPLFILLVLLGFNYLLQIEKKRIYIFYAAVFGALSFWVRANGLFFILITIGYIIFQNYNNKDAKTVQLANIGLAILIVILISFPHLYLRWIAFGNPMYYGVNSNYWADSIGHAWAENAPNYSLSYYFAHHSFFDFFKRLFFFGIIAVMKGLYAMAGEFWMLLFLIGSIYLLIVKCDKKTFLTVLTAWIFIGLMFPLYKVFHASRHLIIALPFVILIALQFFNFLTKDIKYKNTLYLIFAFIYISTNNAAIDIHDSFNVRRYNEIHHYDSWVQEYFEKYNADAIAHYVMPFQTYEYYIEKNGEKLKSLSDLNNEMPFKIIKTGFFNSIDDAYLDMKRQGIKYIIVDNLLIKEYPFYNEISKSNKFILIDEFENKGRNIFSNVKIYKAI
ncbi:MAG: glycosyltransferase family 39 protein [Salinivirgaceae bacterium]|nr:glycosyltransferase family 39 protein [Salinivirgaceae bacterium]